MTTRAFALGVLFASMGAMILTGFFGHITTATVFFVAANLALIVLACEGRGGDHQHEGQDRCPEHQDGHPCAKAGQARVDAPEGEYLSESHPQRDAGHPSAALTRDESSFADEDDEGNRDGLRDHLTLLGADLHAPNANASKSSAGAK